MTCIVGLIEDGRVWMGADSQATDERGGVLILSDADQKVFVNGPYLMGFCGSIRMGQLLRYSLMPPFHDEAFDDASYMATTFIDSVRDCLKEGGYARHRNNVEEGGNFLVGYHGNLYEVHDDFAVARVVEPYVCLGSGVDIAYGSLYSTTGDPENRILLALEAAERFNAYVRQPFAILTA